MRLQAPATSLLVSVFGTVLFALPAMAQTETKPPATYPALPSEIPAKFTPKNDSFDYSRRNVTIPMRDGVKLHTVILIPKGAKGTPILLTRTPYSADKLTSHAESAHLGPVLYGYDNALDVILEGGYIRVVQDVRGKHGSEGDYIVNRPLRGPQNPTPVDHATDTWDTIDWLVKNIAESNGKVGILGISYNGFLPLMALVDPHPALKVSVPMNPMVDGWIGDDWFHYGAFRQFNVPWIYDQVATRKGDAKWWRSHNDEYDTFMQAGSAGELGRRRGLDQLGFWNKLALHPAYDAFWRDQAVDKLLAKQPLKTPVMLVHSLWDQEDIYGAPAVYKAIEPKDAANDKVFLVIGPWHHGQMIGNGSSLGAVKFGSDTALYFRQKILAPFLAQYLKDGAPKADIAPVTAFETGTNAWRRYSAWPPKAEGDRAGKMTPLYLRAGLKLSHEAPKPGDAAFEEYISDPAKPVPFVRRPIPPMGYEEGNPWPRWLVDDQREASGRPDVLTFTSDTLTAPMKIAGEPVANLVASTSGTDSDWVVKLIDVYPDEVGGDAAMGGYQLMIAADIFRGRYRESFATAKPIAPDTPLLYRFPLPTANHVFLPRHRIMVQIQSSWFPLYDRNPQTFVPNIFWAKAGDYRKATQRVYHAPEQSSFIELPLAPATASARAPAASGLSVSAGDDARDKPATPEEQYKALVKDFYQAANLSFNATTDEERAKQVARAMTLAPRLLELAKKHPHEAFVMDALIQVVSQELWLQANTRDPGRGNDRTEATALELLLRDHIRSDKLGEACRRAQYGFGKQCEAFLRTVMEKSPHRDVRALACLRLAQFLDGRLKRLDLVKEQPDMAKRYEGLFGKDYLDGLLRQDRAEAVKEVEAVFELAGANYADVKVPYGGTVAERVKTELYEIRFLSVRKTAPDIEGDDQDGNRFKLSDYRGKVVLLYFWQEY